ncbi:hypothetical protein B0H15DRAFT_423743 [Mycena belliarum]|uniref:Uncharacterized protein n=1 Tax=Mycena belliarum TaxID=1033014 RepID=A0AAD6U3F1_9AGAR|nr:hypothetical protein B0H15DRAFT_423743 [Mycena belliae]
MASTTTTTLRRAGVASPTRAAAFQVQGHSPRPILKRPSPLKLSANPLAASFTIVVSPAGAISSPHVHFPASPVLTAIFTTHSPASYDRSATKVAPNPLELPEWGERVYSPGTDAFSAVKSPSASGPLLFTDAGTPRAARFGSRSRELGKALAVYPRSPYPTAPASPTSSWDKENTDSPGVTRTRSLDSKRALTKNMNMKRPAALNVPVGRPASPRLASPRSTKFLSPVPESLTPRTATIASTLSHEFWQSLSLANVDDGDYRLSVLEAFEEGSTPISAIPRFVFSTRDGLLWSPGLPPKSSSSVRELRSAADRASFELDRSTVTSPGKHSSYPSIAAVLATDAATITYPPPIVSEADLM